VIRKNAELLTLQHVTEVQIAAIHGKQFSVKRTLSLFRRRQLSREELQRPPAARLAALLESGTDMCRRGICYQ
jgi:hypothetical protein